MHKVIRRVLRACSVDSVNVEEARKIADLKAIGFSKFFHKKIDTSVNNEGYEVPVRIFFPDKETMRLCTEGQNQLPVIIYIHGGGWITDGIDNYERICDKIACVTKYMVISVDYRLAPEYRFPIGLQDCYTVVKSVCTDTFTYAINTTDITVMGDSAGGNLTTVVCMMGRDRDEFQCSNQVLIYPAVGNDYSENSPYESVRSKGSGYGLTAGKMQDYLTFYEKSEKDRENPYFSPIIATDLEKLPRALVITAENDPLRDEGEIYGNQLKNAGIEVQIYRIDDAIHGYFGMGLDGPYVKKTLYLVNRFLKEI
ncbi:MAG: alpha/beta hydrolase [Eubacteriales bacterium]